MPKKWTFWLWIRLAKCPFSLSYSEAAFMVSNLAYKACNESWGTLVTFNDVLQNNLIKTFARECLLSLVECAYHFYSVFYLKKFWTKKIKWSLKLHERYTSHIRIPYFCTFVCFSKWIPIVFEIMEQFSTVTRHFLWRIDNLRRP